MVTLSNEKVGKYFGEHFVSAYQQKGDFEVVRVNDKLQKTGGNVVSYFCTSDMRVLNFVVGPVEPDVLLKEARFAVEAAEALKTAKAADSFEEPPAVPFAKRPTAQVKKGDQASTKGSAPSKPAANGVATANGAAAKRERPDKISKLQWTAIRDLHLKRAGDGADGQIQQLTRGDPMHGRVDYTKSYQKGYLENRWSRLVGSVWSEPAKRPHQLLAFDPLPPLAVIDTAVFQQIAGERVNDQDGSVSRAVADVEQAAKDGKPIMFVFYGDAAMWRDSAERRNLLQKPIPKLIAQFAVVKLPLKELPALSAALKGFELPVAKQQASVQIVLLDCQRRQLAVTGDTAKPAEFAESLISAVEQNQLAYAQRLVDARQAANGNRILAVARKSKKPEVRAKAESLLAALERTRLAMAK